MPLERDNAMQATPAPAVRLPRRRAARGSLPIAWGVRPRCPECAGFKFSIHATREQEDQSQEKWATCEGCGLYLKIVLDVEP